MPALAPSRADWFNRLGGMVLLRYAMASGIALAADLGVFMAALQLGMPAVRASVLSYLLGIVVHWLVSSRAVFADSVAVERAARTRQKLLFTVAALAGLAVTSAIVWAGTRLGIDPRLAKLGAVGASFVVTWLLRRRIVFG